MSIQNYVNELNRIEVELKRLRATTKKLNSRKKELQENIQNFLISKDQKGVKYQGKAIILDQKEKHEYKSVKDKERDGINYLRDLGISDPEGAYTELMEKMRGEKVSTHKLKITNIKK